MNLILKIELIRGIIRKILMEISEMLMRKSKYIIASCSSLAEANVSLLVTSINDQYCVWMKLIAQPIFVINISIWVSYFLTNHYIIVLFMSAFLRRIWIHFIIKTIDVQRLCGSSQTGSVRVSQNFAGVAGRVRFWRIVRVSEVFAVLMVI